MMAPVFAEVLPAALAPVAVIVLVVCLLSSLIPPGGLGPRGVQSAVGLAALVFLVWVLSDATSCDAACSSGQDVLTLVALAVGPGVVLAATLLAALLVRFEAEGPGR